MDGTVPLKHRPINEDFIRQRGKGQNSLLANHLPILDDLLT